MLSPSAVTVALPQVTLPSSMAVEPVLSGLATVFGVAGELQAIVTLALPP